VCDSWERVRLGEVLAIKHGYAFKSEYFSRELTGRPIVVNIGNFSYTGGFRFATTQTREFKGNYPKEFELSAGDLLVVMTCQTSGGEILGLPAVVADDGRVYLHNQRIGKVLVDARRLNVRFAYYLFLAPSVNRQLAATATGTKILHTSPQRIAGLTVLLPPLTDQRAIAAVLGALDDKIEANRTLVEMAERLAISLPASTIATTTVGAIAAVYRKLVSTASFASRSVEHFSLPAFDAERLPIVENGDGIKSGKFLLERATVLVSKLNPHIPRVWMATPSEVRPAITSTEFVGLVPTADYPVAALWALCASSAFSSQLIEMVKGTTGSHQRVSPEDVLALEVPDPRTLAQETTETIAATVGLAGTLRRESVHLATLRDTLLPRLLSGELRVRDAEAAVEEVA
jgi:type I restriction enzyme S subunit